MGKIDEKIGVCKSRDTRPLRQFCCLTVRKTTKFKQQLGVNQTLAIKKTFCFDKGFGIFSQ